MSLCKLSGVEVCALLAYSSSMDQLARLTEEARKLAPARFRLLQPHLEHNRPLKAGNMNTNTSSHRGKYWQLAFWTALLVVVLYLLNQQSTGGMRLISLPGLFLSIGMLCHLSRAFVSQIWLRHSLTVIACVLFACSLAASLRLLVTR